MIPKELLEILACPRCKEKVELNEAADSLDCHRCRLRYRIDDDIPDVLIVVELPEEEDLDLGVRFLLLAEKPRREDPGLVDDQAIPLLHIVDEVAEPLLFDCIERAVEDHQARRIPRFCGMLGDEIPGQRILKVGKLHFEFTPGVIKYSMNITLFPARATGDILL